MALRASAGASLMVGVGRGNLSISVHETNAAARGRLTAIKLTVHTLRLMENWRRNVSDYDSLMILLAVVAITAERLTRGDVEPRYMRIAEPFPADRLASCNISSIAAATGINRETARRKVNELVAKGILERSAGGAIGFSAGYLQQGHIHEIIREQLDAVVRLTNDLCRDGILVCSETGCATG